MKRQHTPGPWHFGKDSHEILTSRGQGVAAPCDGYDEEQWLIDGPMIAATPDLLSACKAAYVALPMTKRNEPINAALCAAILKAEGGAQ